MFIFFWIFIQIIAEVLPVSSSGHIFLLEQIWRCLGSGAGQDHPLETIDFLLHIPTFFVLLLFFFKRWWNMALNRRIHYSVFFEKESWVNIMQAIFFLGCSSAVTYLFWSKRYYTYFTVPVSVGFLCTGVILYAMKFLPKGKKMALRPAGKYDYFWQVRDAVVLGFVQGAMMNPGFSRFGFTLAAGRILGYNPTAALSISFLLEAPLLLGAGARSLFDLYKDPTIFSEYFAIREVFVMLVATILSYFVLKAVNWLVEKDKLHYISGYMIVPAVMSLLFERCS